VHELISLGELTSFGLTDTVTQLH